MSSEAEGDPPLHDEEPYHTGTEHPPSGEETMAETEAEANLTSGKPLNEVRKTTIKVPDQSQDAIGDVGASLQDKSVTLLGISVILVVAALVWHYWRRSLGGEGIFGGKKRTNTLLVGLCGAGKTALFAQLCSPTPTVVDTNTSMEVNCGTVGGKQDGAPVVDFPGHRRLQGSLWGELAAAKRVVVVIDSVTIQDDRHEGAPALAELLFSLFQAPEFVGVEAVLMACTKRDELTSYSSTAIIRLLSTAMGDTIRSKQGDIGSVDRVVDSKGKVIERKSDGRRRALRLECSDGEKFSFDTFSRSNNFELSFKDISSIPSKEHKFNVEPVLNFIQ